MKILITDHAKERMKKYNVDEKGVIQTIENPTDILDSHSNRVIFQRTLNGYVLRVICEKVKSTVIVITIYKARRGRYEV